MTTLREAAEMALEALKVSTTPRAEDRQVVLMAQAALRESLADHFGQATEMVKPVAWMYTSKLAGDQTFITRYASDLSTYKADKITPLYSATPQRKPLTDEEVIQMALEAGFERNSLGWTFTYGRLDYHLTKFARAIERAHGIGGEE